MSHAVEDRIIAEIGDRSILYSEIWCSREVTALNPRWLKERTVEDACVDAERENFRRIAAVVMVEQAFVLEGRELSEEELDRHRSPILRDEAMLRGLAAEARKVPEAVRRVYLGEPIEAVFDEVVRPMMNASLESFRLVVSQYRSLETVERALAKDFIANARQQFERNTRLRAMQSAIRANIEAIAAARDQSLTEAAEDYYCSLIVRIGVNVHDDRYQLPEAREVFLPPDGARLAR